MFDQGIAQFLGLGLQPTLRLCLPRFRQGVVGARDGDPFRYPSNAYAERDVRSALHVHSLASEAGAAVGFISPDDLATDLASSEPDAATSVVFSSRSNSALDEVLGSTGLQFIFDFDFGSQWAIRLADGARYALDDPSKLSRDEYSARIDYGVVAGCRSAGGRSRSVFMVAGLGGRATEGCGLYLQRRWRWLADQVGDRAFAAVLRFDPPVDPASSTLERLVIH